MTCAKTGNIIWRYKQQKLQKKQQKKRQMIKVMYEFQYHKNQIILE